MALSLVVRFGFEASSGCGACFIEGRTTCDRHLLLSSSAGMRHIQNGSVL